MSLFPFIDGGTPSQVREANALPTPREYKWDFEKDDFVIVDGRFIIVEGLEAIKIWIYKALRTNRFRHLAYSWDYGHELERLIGSRYSKEVAVSEATRYLQDCLLINPHIQSIRDVQADFSGDVLRIGFTAVTSYGEVRINV